MPKSYFIFWLATVQKEGFDKAWVLESTRQRKT